MLQSGAIKLAYEQSKNNCTMLQAKNQVMPATKCLLDPMNTQKLRN